MHQTVRFIVTSIQSRITRHVKRQEIELIRKRKASQQGRPRSDKMLELPDMGIVYKYHIYPKRKRKQHERKVEYIYIFFLKERETHIEFLEMKYTISEVTLRRKGQQP